MDVTLPDGTVIRGVPDGTTKAELRSKLASNGYDVSKLDPPQPSGAESLAKETGAGEAFLVSAGRKTQSIVDGILQKYLEFTGDTKALGGLKQNVAARDAEFEPLAKERPISTGLGGALPAMAVPGAGAGYVGAMAAGAIPELLSYGTTQERLSRGGVGAVGGAVGRGLSSAIPALLKPAGVGVNPNREAMDAAGRIGFKPLAGQATQNPALLNVENYLARTPGSSGTMQALNQANTEAINRTAARSIWQTGTEVGPSMLGAAQKTLGSEFTRLQAITAPQLGTDFVESLVKVEAANAARGPFRSAPIDSLLDKAMNLAAQGKLSGTAYKEIHTELASEGTKAFKAGDASLGQAYKTVREALDDAAGKSLSEADQRAWDMVRSQWGNWKTLMKGQVAEAGNVSPARVASQLRAQGPGFRTGAQGPLQDIGRIGEGIKTATNPNSGNLGQMMLYGNPVTGIPLAVGNAVAAKVYTNPLVQRYLREGILDVGKSGELVIKATGVPLGIAATNKLLGVE